MTAVITTRGGPDASAGCARSTASTSTCAPATSTVPGRQRLGQDHTSGCCSGSCCPPARSSCWAAHAARRTAGAPACGAPHRGPPATATSPGGRTWRSSTPPARAFLAHPAARIDEVSSSGAGRVGRRGEALLLGMRQSSAWPARCCAVRSCSCSTSRPTAWTRRASPRCAAAARPARRDDGLPVQSPAGRGGAAVLARGVLDRARLVLQDCWRSPPRPGDRRAHPDPDRVRACSTAG